MLQPAAEAAGRKRQQRQPFAPCAAASRIVAARWRAAPRRSQDARPRLPSSSSSAGAWNEPGLGSSESPLTPTIGSSYRYLHPQTVVGSLTEGPQDEHHRPTGDPDCTEDLVAVALAADGLT